MTPREIAEKMLAADAFSQWMGIEIIDATDSLCVLKMKVRDDMLNGFKITHGGVLFSFADSALAFICNGAGRQALSIDTSIRTFTSTQAGDILFAKAVPLSVNYKVASYDITIANDDGLLIAQFSGTVYRSSKDWK